MTTSASESAERRKGIGRIDPLLAAALLLAFIFCLHGITWGRVECWNPDKWRYAVSVRCGRAAMGSRHFTRI